jgi:hypothetical protein
MFTHRTVELTFTVMVAGSNLFFVMLMVLSDTEAVRDGVITGVGRDVVIIGDGVTGTLVGETVGCAGGTSEHPQVKISRHVMSRSTEINLIDAGRSFPYKKVMAPLIARQSRPCVTVPAGPALRGGCRRLLMSRGSAGTPPRDNNRR